MLHASLLLLPGSSGQGMVGIAREVRTWQRNRVQSGTAAREKGKELSVPDLQLHSIKGGEHSQSFLWIQSFARSCAMMNVFKHSLYRESLETWADAELATNLLSGYAPE